MSFLRILICALLGVTAIFPQAAQPLKIGSLLVQGSVRTRLESWDWFGRGDASSYIYAGTVVRVGVGQQRSTFDWQVELEAPILLGLPDDAVQPGAAGQLGLGGTYYAANDRSRNAAMVFPKQGYIRVKRLFGSEYQTLRLGRFEFLDGSETTPVNATLAALKRERISQRLIGNFGWSHVGRSYDGGHYTWQRGRTNFTAVGGLPTRGVFQTDGWGHLDVGLVYAALTREVGTKRSSGELRLLGIYYDDWRNVLKTDNRPFAPRAADTRSIRVGTFGGHYLHAVETSMGTVDVMAWGIAQTGRWGSLDHTASAMALEAGWQLPMGRRWKPWIRGGYFHGSGDGNPLDNKHETFFQLLPTPRPFARFPFFDLMNNRDAHGSLQLQPVKSVTVKCEIHSLWLANRNDLWYQGGGAFQPWTFGYAGRPSTGASGLANLYDASADYAINRHTTISGYFGYAAGKAVIESVYTGGQDGKFGYLELTHRF